MCVCYVRYQCCCCCCCCLVYFEVVKSCEVPMLTRELHGNFPAGSQVSFQMPQQMPAPRVVLPGQMPMMQAVTCWWLGGDTGSFWFLYPFAWVGCSNNRSICCQWNNWSYLPAWLLCLLIGIQDWPRFRAASGDRSKRNSKRNVANWQLLGGLKYLLFP